MKRSSSLLENISESHVSILTIIIKLKADKI
jgi:hypothetical protein